MGVCMVLGVAPSQSFCSFLCMVFNAVTPCSAVWSPARSLLCSHCLVHRQTSVNAFGALQKGKDKKQKKKISKTDTLQEQRKNKKEMEFELKLAKEKEEMYEREKQLKISRLVQEVRLRYECRVHRSSLTDSILQRECWQGRQYM